MARSSRCRNRKQAGRSACGCAASDGFYWQRSSRRQLRNLQRAVKANFNPNQPRVPRGNPDGGEWTGTGGSGGRTRVAQMPRGGRRIGSDAEGTAAEEALRVVEEAQAREAIRRVREIDPSWKPSDSLTDPNSAAGPIERARGQRQEAEDRLIELAKQPADSLIDAYRRQQGLDLFGEPNWSRAENSVALCKVGAKPFIGVNSEALTYTKGDNASAERLRDALIKSSPGHHEYIQYRAVSQQRYISCRNDVSLASRTRQWRHVGGTNGRGPRRSHYVSQLHQNSTAGRSGAG